MVPQCRSPKPSSGEATGGVEVDAFQEDHGLVEHAVGSQSTMRHPMDLHAVVVALIWALQPVPSGHQGGESGEGWTQGLGRPWPRSAQRARRLRRTSSWLEGCCVEVVPGPGPSGLFTRGRCRVVDHPRRMAVMHAKQPKRPGAFVQRKVQDTLNHAVAHVPGCCRLPFLHAWGLGSSTACHWGAQRSVHFPSQVQCGLACHAACVGGSWKPVNPSCASLARVAGLNVPP